MIHSGIKEAMEKDRLVFFIGSGFSRSLGFPNWREMIIEFINELSVDEPELEEYKIVLKHISEIEVLEKLYPYRARLYKIMDKIFQLKEHHKEKIQLHKKIGEIATKIITTNYDKLFELALPDYKKIDNNNIFGIGNLEDIEKYIFKIHGCIDNPQTCVLFKSDYEELYVPENPAINRLNSIITDYTIVFIGFSLTDEHVRDQFERINKMFDGLARNHFIITTEETNLTKYNVKQIKLTEWSQLNKWFDSLIEVKRTYQETSIAQREVLIEVNPNIEVVQSSKKYLTKILILIASPLDREISYDFGNIAKYFSKYDVKIDCLYLTEETLHSLEDYDYLFIFSFYINKKIVIEDQMHKSKLISLETLEQHLGQEFINCIFLFLDKDITDQSYEELNYPWTILNYNEVEISNFVFSIVKKNNLNLLKSSMFINKEKIILLEAEKGNAIITIREDEEKKILASQIDPKRLSSFIGRTTDIVDITRKIIELNNQILTIKGSGGIGKTTIVKKVAYELFKRSYFSNGIKFVDCEPIKDYESFASKISSCFDLDNVVNFRDHISLNDFSLDMLLILDNFEVLVYLSDYEQIKDLVSFICDYVKVTITSREWIGLEYEEQHELRALTSEESLKIFKNNYNSKIDSSDEKYLKNEILDKLLNNNPLAIKLITKNLPKNIDVKILYQELSDDFFYFTNSGYFDIYDNNVDDKIERSESLYHSINYSYERLNSKEKLTFELLSLFPDGISMELFKQFFESKEFKYELNKITNKEITSLENKSLIEINSGLIELQSIIGKFASHQLINRTAEELSKYYKRAYQFNDFNLEMYSNVKKKYHRSKALGILDSSAENYLLSLSYIDKFEGDKSEKILYISYLSSNLSIIEQSPKFTNKLNDLIGYFEDLENGSTYLKLLICNINYFSGHFDESFSTIKKIFPISDWDKYDLRKTLNRSLISNVLNTYEMEGFEIQTTQFVLENLEFLYERNILSDLFKLGEFQACIEAMSSLTQESFFTFEIKYNLDQLDPKELIKYIENIYKKEFINIVQSNYILSKMKKNNKKNINQLVVTNAYTHGLKNLMLAFIEENDEKANNLYLKAISNLKHIKYYYLEAIYFYSDYLKSKNSADYEKWVNQGFEEVKEHNYKYLIHQYKNLMNDTSQIYVESDILLNSEYDYLSKVRQYIKKRDKEYI
ncbi:SIR2 family protein [Paenibacillus whitsoniae]|uniref:SIR2-like domain-containing protein n=1 Tax=Paenibacillus whitsoniae TaxID=2496558 RepID=A0A430JCC9_9BACL|nr:SIR2 family protein [Paenibacillus whitsoniae]RTE08639.1 hypothetical protein EJQ19_16260 [Paenibacillus whitsoniae]